MINLLLLFVVVRLIRAALFPRRAKDSAPKDRPESQQQSGSDLSELSPYEIEDAEFEEIRGRAGQ